MKLFISKTPLRISLFGGGTDLKSYYKKENGAVMSFSINKFLYVILKKNEKLVDFKYRINWSKTEFANKINEIEHPIVREAFRMFKINFPIEVSTFSDIPANTGLGSSSAFAVGLIHCISKLLNLKFSKNKIAEIAAKIEIDILRRNIGKQDHFASAFGGFNIIKFNKSEKVTVIKQKLSQQIVNKLNKSFLVFFLNKKRDASKILSNQKKLQKENYSSLDKIKKIVFIAEKLIKQNNAKIVENFGALLSENWYLKKINNPSVSYKVVDKLYGTGMRSGSYGGKLLGAGGGGYFLFLANSESKKKMKSKFCNFSTIDVEIHKGGTEIIYAHK